MHPKVNETYQKLAEKYEMKGPFLEVGIGNRESAILSGPYFLGKPERFATNLSEMEVLDEEGDRKIQFIRCNANNMKEVFADGQFGTVLSNAVIEHDKYFWRSLEEMKRVLAPGGLLAIGAPGYIPRKRLKGDVLDDRFSRATVTADVHSRPDYWRFSDMAFEEVLCEGLEVLEMCVVGRIPVLMAVARKPLEGLLEPVAQEDRLRMLEAKREAILRKREAKLLERGAKPGTEMPARAEAGPARKRRDAKLQAREARLQAHEAKVQARKARRQKQQAAGDGNAED